MDPKTFLRCNDPARPFGVRHSPVDVGDRHLDAWPVALIPEEDAECMVWDRLHGSIATKDSPSPPLATILRPLDSRQEHLKWPAAHDDDEDTIGAAHPSPASCVSWLVEEWRASRTRSISSGVAWRTQDQYWPSALFPPRSSTRISPSRAKTRTTSAEGWGEEARWAKIQSRYQSRTSEMHWSRESAS